MLPIFLRTLASSAACLGFYFLTRNALGPIVWVFLAVLIGVLFSRIVIDTFAELGWQVRRRAMGSLNAKYYRFQSVPMAVVECDEHCRWIRCDDIRKVIERLPSDATLHCLFPAGFAQLGKPARGYLRDDALLAYLSQANAPRAIRLKLWVERNVALPARKIRQQKGIRIAELAPAASNCMTHET